MADNKDCLATRLLSNLCVLGLTVRLVFANLVHISVDSMMQKPDRVRSGCIGYLQLSMSCSVNAVNAALASSVT